MGLFSKKNEETINYNDIDSKEKIIHYCKKGYLKPIYLFPTEVGGQEGEENIVYVPECIVEVKNKTTDTLIEMIEKELLNQMDVLAEYIGKSLIPSKIILKAWHNNKDGNFDQTIKIWE